MPVRHSDCEALNCDAAGAETLQRMKDFRVFSGCDVHQQWFSFTPGFDAGLVYLRCDYDLS